VTDLNILTFYGSAAACVRCSEKY